MRLMQFVRLKKHSLLFKHKFNKPTQFLMKQSPQILGVIITIQIDIFQGQTLFQGNKMMRIFKDRNFRIILRLNQTFMKQKELAR